jgi:chromosome segregation ATPase
LSNLLCFALLDVCGPDQASDLSSQVESMSSNVAELRTELEALKARHEATLRQLADSTEKAAAHERQLEQLRAQLHEERTSNQIGQATRRNLVQVCTELVQDAQTRAGQAVSQLSERLMLEREDILAHFARVKFDEEQVQEWRKKETDAELERLSMYVLRLARFVLMLAVWFG